MATRKYQKKEETKKQTIIGICTGYVVKTASNDSEYADVKLKDDKGVVYNCKLWNWDNNYKEYLYPRRYVVVANVKRNLYKGEENFIISDLSVDDEISPKDYDPDIIDGDILFHKYTSLIDENVSDKIWKQIIMSIALSNEVEIKNGVCDTRVGANINGSLIKSLCKAMAKSLSSSDVDYGYLCYSALMSCISKGLMSAINEDGNSETREECNFYGYIGLPLLTVRTLLSKDNMPDVPSPYRKLALQSILSVATAGQSSLYPAIYNNSLEGRIVYHVSCIDFVDDTINEYAKGNTDSLISVPELSESFHDKGIKFVIPKRIINNG
jgi:hypothetical protein